MSTNVFVAVLLAALLHASWNALVKGGADPKLNMACVVLGHAPLSVPLMFVMPLPDPQSWPYLVAGIGAHFGYQIFLLNA